MEVSKAGSPRVDIEMGSYSEYTCGRCAMLYKDYKQLLEHLYWRHGTESRLCKECGLKRWRYAAHVCHVLPIFIDLLEDSNELCFCGKEVEDVPMIGCDGPRCAVQWYHFSCVGIVRPPEGDWFCPTCRNKDNKSSQNSRILSSKEKT